MEKGFTLVELLVVMAILSLVAIISVPIVTNVITDSREKAYKEQEKAIIDAAKTYMTTHSSELPNEETNTKTITVEMLKEAGLLKNDDIKNPVGENYKEGIEESTEYIERDETFNGSVIVSWNGTKYIYAYVN